MILNHNKYNIYQRKYQSQRRKKARIIGACTEHINQKKPCKLCKEKLKFKKLNGICDNCTKKAILGKARCEGCLLTRRLSSLPRAARANARKAAQNFGGACDACGGFDNGGMWCLDHDHKTRKFRGILCGGCNLALGHAKDSVGILNALISYLKATS